MKKPTASVRASHLNTATGIPTEERAWPGTSGRVTRLPQLHLEVAERSTVTSLGGVALAAAFLKRFRVAQEIDQRVHVLKLHLPFNESDHVLAQALNLYVGGECLEDQAVLQHDEGVLRMLGACRLPDPTTAGDFLRRFDERRNPGALPGLRAATDAVQDAVWGKLAGKRKQKRDLAVVDLDGHTKTLYGVQKEGADFDYQGRWSYNVLLASLAGTGECLAVRNRPGNLRS
ncbi:MAG: transposase, partial [Gemmatimonadetes bacterium]|nr:transposase [Gemmatimonadota bacterium]